MLQRLSRAGAIGRLGGVGLLVGLLGAGLLVAGSAPEPAPDEVPILADLDPLADEGELDEASLDDLVADAQRMLRLRGYDPGPIDGQLGPRTRQAIRTYQEAVRADGLLEALKGEPGSAAAPESRRYDFEARPTPSSLRPD
jgi:peptidoglycan hydrolase-like protein with peptidoglycan-binding domain